jgi:hypothetical protein
VASAPGGLAVDSTRLCSLCRLRHQASCSETTPRAAACRVLPHQRSRLSARSLAETQRRLPLCCCIARRLSAGCCCFQAQDAAQARARCAARLPHQCSVQLSWRPLLHNHKCRRHQRAASDARLRPTNACTALASASESASPASAAMTLWGWCSLALRLHWRCGLQCGILTGHVHAACFGHRPSCGRSSSSRRCGAALASRVGAWTLWLAMLRRAKSRAQVSCASPSVARACPGAGDLRRLPTSPICPDRV